MIFSLALSKIYTVPSNRIASVRRFNGCHNIIIDGKIKDTVENWYEISLLTIWSHGIS